MIASRAATELDDRVDVPSPNGTDRAFRHAKDRLSTPANQNVVPDHSAQSHIAVVPTGSTRQADSVLLPMQQYAYVSLRLYRANTS
jgi:hypothetical protein